MTNWFEFSFELVYRLAQGASAMFNMLTAELRIGWLGWRVFGIIDTPELILFTISMWQLLAGIGLFIIILMSILKYIVPVL